MSSPMSGDQQQVSLCSRPANSLLATTNTMGGAERRPEWAWDESQQVANAPNKWSSPSPSPSPSSSSPPPPPPPPDKLHFRPRRAQLIGPPDTTESCRCLHRRCANPTPEICIGLMSDGPHEALVSHSAGSAHLHKSASCSRPRAPRAASQRPLFQATLCLDPSASSASSPSPIGAERKINFSSVAQI